MNLSFDPKPEGMRCNRCKKEGGNSESWVTFMDCCPPGTILSSTDSEKCDPLMVMHGYHLKCVPPNLYHKFAGSLPADHAVPMLSLIKRQHSKGTAWNRIARGSR